MSSELNRLNPMNPRTEKSFPFEIILTRRQLPGVIFRLFFQLARGSGGGAGRTNLTFLTFNGDPDSFFPFRNSIN